MARLGPAPIAMRPCASNGVSPFHAVSASIAASAGRASVPWLLPEGCAGSPTHTALDSKAAAMKKWRRMAVLLPEIFPDMMQ